MAALGAGRTAGATRRQRHHRPLGAPGQHRGCGVLRPARGGRDRRRVRQVARLLAARLRDPVDRSSGRAAPAYRLRSRSVPDQGAGARPVPGRLVERRAGEAGDRAGRRLVDRGTRLGPRPRDVRAEQSGHAAPVGAAEPPALGPLPRLPAVRRGGRVPPLPGRLRRPRRRGAAPAAAELRALRRPSGLRPRLRDGVRPGGLRRAPDRSTDDSCRRGRLTGPAG